MTEKSTTSHQPKRLKRNVSPSARVRKGDDLGGVSQKKGQHNKSTKALRQLIKDRSKGGGVKIPLRFRVGFNENRPSYVPSLGEPIFTVDDARLWIGDEFTPGGIPVSVSQWPIDSLEDLKLLEDAEVGDFAFYRDRTRCFMLVNPPPTSKVAWMELHVEPLVSDDEKKAERYLNAINAFLVDWLIEERFADNDENRLVPKGTRKDTASKLMADRRVLNDYLVNKSEDKVFPKLKYKSYSKL